jgi:uncharacterized protein YjbI with pentapeptide repeats
MGQQHWGWRSLGCLLLLCILLFWPSSPLLAAANWQRDNTVDYTLADLRNRDFSGQDLSGTSFAGAEMQEANFQGADLSGTILTKGMFNDANLSGANLSEVFGDRADFSGANLSNAIFADSILTSSHFFDANITGADFSGAMVDRFQVKTMCESAEGINPVTGIATRDSLGC